MFEPKDIRMLMVLERPSYKAGNLVVLMIGSTEFRAGIPTKHVRK